MSSPALVLALSLLGISAAAPLIRLSASSGIVIAIWRLGFALLVIVPVLVSRGEWRQWSRLSPADVRLVSAAGVLLALHFWSWNTSLQYTTVAASVVLVNVQPIVIGIASALWLHEAPSPRQWWGIVAAVVGALIIGGGDLLAAQRESSASGVSMLSSRALFGDVLALVGALTGAFYFLIGRRVRQLLDIWAYVSLVYGVALVACVVIAIVSGASLAVPGSRELAIFSGLAIGPMLLGHTGMNWALGHLPAYVVNLTTLGEPVGATILAMVLPGIAETPSAFTVVGGLIVLIGVLVASRRSG
jgi:drug/metabolite transporter (DMT)-like permease